MYKKKKNIYNVEGKGLKIDDLIDSGLNKTRLNSDTEEKTWPPPCPQSPLPRELQLLIPVGRFDLWDLIEL